MRQVGHLPEAVQVFG